MLKNIEQLYTASEFNDITHKINGLVYPFNNKWDSIAVAISGGADSALLTHLLCAHITEHRLSTEINLIHNIRCWKSRPWQKYIADTVIDYITRQFNHLQFKVHYNFVPPDIEHAQAGRTITDEYGRLVSGDTLELRAFAEYTCYHGGIPVYFNAVTKNPPVELGGELSARNIEPDENTFRLMIMRHLNFLACHPFRFVDKSWIISTYKLLSLHKLLELTRSCEGEFSDINYATYAPGQWVPVCGKCFWCRERSWGIDYQE